MKIFKQIAIIIGFSLLGEILSWSLSKLIPNFFFPGSLIGMMILFLFLNFNIIKIDAIASVGSFSLIIWAFSLFLLQYPL